MTDLMRRFVRNENAATSIEYAIIAAGIAVAIVTVVGSLGTEMSNKYTNVSTALQ